MEKYMGSGRAEFIALYGRRRVGKTFLVRSFFKDKFDFYATGIIEGSKDEEMAAFNDALTQYGHTGKAAKTWMEAFGHLAELLKKKGARGRRLVVFIDELPCFDTKNSRFIHALDYFWNSKASWMDNVFFIVCGSATSWMIRNIVDNHGGLHNRITHEMHLQPFTLRTTEEYLKQHRCRWNRLGVLQMYMAIGGVPYYLSLLDYDLSVADNIDKLFFSDGAELKKEYRRLFKSLYKEPENYMGIISLLADHKQGLTRLEIADKMKLPNNGHLSDMLDDLVNCDFLRLYNNGTKQINGIYQLVDFYTLFYHQFCRKRTTDIHFWRTHLNTPMQNNWYGLAFERICLYHYRQVIRALHLDTIHTEFYSWRSREATPAAQIDLIIDRADGIITICEVKYSRGDYALTKGEYDKLTNRIIAFETETKCKKGVQAVVITTFGLVSNSYSDISTRTVMLDDLFMDSE